jgi:uncharacterized SAM-binding protein YcdF (DUF218 family)
MRDRGIKRVLLVTSAMHMPRAHGAFRRLGVDAVPATTDIRVVEVPDKFAQPWFMRFLPSAAALSDSTGAIHEYLGYVYYRLRGWV